MVPICAHTAPWASALATPPSKITEVTTAAVGSMVITTCASRTASTGEAATSAPSFNSGAVAAGDRSQTVVRSPAETRLRAIAEPMMPVPRTVTRTSSSRPCVAVMLGLPSRGPGSPTRPGHATPEGLRWHVQGVRIVRRAPASRRDGACRYPEGDHTPAMPPLKRVSVVCSHAADTAATRRCP